MKKLFVTILVLMMACLTVYFISDRKLYYYGKSHFNIYEKLPLKIKPQYWGYDMGNLGFVLVDESEMTLIAQGNKYWTSNIEVEKIIKYGYTAEKLIALVKAKDGKKYFIQCLKNKDTLSAQDMVIRVLEDSAPINPKEYTWIELDEEYFRKTALLRNYSATIFIILTLVFIYRGVKRRKKSIMNNSF